MPIKIRVQAKTEPEEFRTITVSDDGSEVSCNCGGFDGYICSHIDAVLIAQERAMLHPDDLSFAEQAIKVTSGRLKIPSHWKGAWRRNLTWRGLSRYGTVARKARDKTKPLVCFTGRLHKERAELAQQAEANGWETIDSPSPFTTVLVAADPLGKSAKLLAARKNGTPIITGDEWAMLMEDGLVPPGM